MAKGARKKTEKGPVRKVVAQNRKARHDFVIEETLEAGIVLSGTEVKSIRQGQVSLVDAFAVVTDDGEVFLRGMHVALYKEGTYNNHETRRPRKLLLTKREIRRLARKVAVKGVTLVPLEVYFNERGYAKVTLALARGKKAWDKRESIRKRDEERESRSYRM